MSRTSPRACVLLFARDPVAEESAKRLRRGRCLFELARRRVFAAVAELPGVDLLVTGSAAGHIVQRGTGFGEKLLNAFLDARALGFDRIVVVPIDTPQIEGRHLREAFRALGSRDVVLGGSPDGGVYLIGVRGDVAGLFEGVRWRSSHVGSDLVANAPGAALLTEELPDVDAPSDLRSMRSRAGLDPDLAAVIGWLLSPPVFQHPGSDASRESGRALRLPTSRAPPDTPSFC